MTACTKCLVEHFPLSETTGMCLACGMKERKAANIEKAKSAAIADYQKKTPEKYFEKDGGFNVPTEIPLEPIKPVISIDDF